MHVRYAAWYAGSFAPSASMPASCGSSDRVPPPVPRVGGSVRRASAARLWSLVFGEADSRAPAPLLTASCASLLQAAMFSVVGTSAKPALHHAKTTSGTSSDMSLSAM